MWVKAIVYVKLSWEETFWEAEWEMRSFLADQLHILLELCQALLHRQQTPQSVGLRIGLHLLLLARKLLTAVLQPSPSPTHLLKQHFQRRLNDLQVPAELVDDVLQSSLQHYLLKILSNSNSKIFWISNILNEWSFCNSNGFWIIIIIIKKPSWNKSYFSFLHKLILDFCDIKKTFLILHTFLVKEFHCGVIIDPKSQSVSTFTFNVCKVIDF